MASQTPMGLVGRVGELIHYQMGGKYFSRAAPKKFKQTKATKRRAGEFGRASALASSIRAALEPVIPRPKDKKMQGKLVATVFQWLSGVSTRSNESSPGELEYFSFDETSKSVRERWPVVFKIKKTVSGQLQIEIPAFIPTESIVAPSFTVSVICKIAVGVCDAEFGTPLGKFSTLLNLDYNGKPREKQIIPIDLPATKSSLVVTGASLEYKIMKEGRLKNNLNRAYMPAGIVDAILL